MNKLVTLLICSIITFFMAQIGYARNGDQNTYTIDSISKYVNTNSDYFISNEINKNFSIYNKNKLITLTKKQSKCLQNPHCEVQLDFDIIKFTSYKNVSFKKFESIMSLYFNKTIVVEKKASSPWVGYLCLIISLGLLLLSAYLYKREDQNVLKPQVSTNIDPEVTRLIQANKKLESEVEGMRFLSQKVHLDYEAIKRKYQMAERLPENLKEKLLSYNVNNSSISKIKQNNQNL